MGIEISRTRPRWPGDFTSEDIALCQEVMPYTMTSPEAIVTLAAAVRHVVDQKVPGAFVECGVWRGGSMMAVARTLMDLGEDGRDLVLFDTFEGMTPPTRHDVSREGVSAQELLRRENRSADSLLWAIASLESVRAAVGSVGYPDDRIRYVKGKVEETLSTEAPQAVALLRLDTDWYESTKHELECLYPRLSTGGVLIIDDYGWWGGARTATDEYFQRIDKTPFMIRVDDSGRRIAIKPE
jgi:hypothetical protein